MAKGKKNQKVDRAYVPTNPPILGSGGFTTAPLSAILNGFRDTIDRLKSEPKDETFSGAGLRGILAAVEAVKSGDIDGAIDVLRESKRKIESARKKSLIILVKNFLHRRRSTIFLESILSTLLNARAVQTGHQALESYEKSKPSEDIIDRLRKMAEKNIYKSRKYPDDDIIRRILNPDLRALRGRFSDLGINVPNLGPCAVCNNPSVGEIRSGNGKSWKLCPVCAQNAQEFIDEQGERVNSLLKSLRKSRQDLVEAVALDGKNNKPAQKNLDECNKILSQLEPHTT